MRCLVLAGERGSGDLVLPGDVGAAAQPGAHAVGGTGRLWCVRHRRGGRLGCLDEDWAADMEGVSVPVRFLHGARDAFVPPASAEVLCKNRETSLHLLENAGHAIPLEAGVTLCAAIEGDI